MSPGWDNGSESSAQVGHGRKKVSAKARGNSGCDSSAQKVILPSTSMLLNLALQTLPLLLPAALSAAVVELLKAHTTRVAFSKESNKCAQVVFFTECNFHNCGYNYTMTSQKINPVV